MLSIDCWRTVNTPTRCNDGLGLSEMWSPLAIGWVNGRYLIKVFCPVHSLTKATQWSQYSKIASVWIDGNTFYALAKVCATKKCWNWIFDMELIELWGLNIPDLLTATNHCYKHALVEYMRGCQLLVYYWKRDEEVHLVMNDKSGVMTAASASHFNLALIFCQLEVNWYWYSRIYLQAKLINQVISFDKGWNHIPVQTWYIPFWD